jgi:hypothetical protein
MLSSLASVLTALVAVSSASRTTHHHAKRTTPIAPSQDPWYTCANCTHAKPGDVIKVRTAPGDLASLLPGAASSYNILFATRDSLDQPSWAVTTLFVPTTRAAETTLLSYQIAYDSADVDVSPSYTLSTTYLGSETVELESMELAIAEGWFVNVPDYEGPNASFTAGLASGYATLDSVRAVLAYSAKASADVNTALW